MSMLKGQSIHTFSMPRFAYSINSRPAHTK